MGGIENQNRDLAIWLPKFAEVTTIANPYGKKFLPFFLPYAILRSLLTMHRYDAILFGDGVLSIVGYIGKLFRPQKVFVSVIHGLDITFQNTFYQKWWVQHFIPALDHIIVVSEETKKLALRKNIPVEKITVIPNGIDTTSFENIHYTKKDLEMFLKKDLQNTFVLLTSGRLAKRKGVEWFIRNVLPDLPPSVIYIVAGTGNQETTIKCAIEEMQMKERVLMLGRVSDETRNLLLQTVDLFIQPNIHIDGDMEGFGIAVIEASLCGRPVIASNIEGLKDAIISNENGILVESENKEDFLQKIQDFIQDKAVREAFGRKAKTYTKNHYDWRNIAPLYIQTLKSLKK